MAGDYLNIYVEFHGRARAIYFDALSGFENAVKEMNRQTDEYRFVQLKENHIHTLKQELEDAAGAIIQQHQNCKQMPEVQQNLQQIIRDYLHGFVMKSRAI